MKLGKEWGKHTWTFFHCLAESIKPEDFNTIGPTVFGWIVSICNILPCPICAKDATQLLNAYKHYNKIKTRDDFKTFIFNLHNIVNKKTHKKEENIEILESYKDIKLGTATANWYNNFVVNMYDVKLIWDKKTRNNTRRRVLRELRANSKYFNI